VESVQGDRYTGFWIRAERSRVELGTLHNSTIQSRPVLRQTPCQFIEIVASLSIAIPASGMWVSLFWYRRTGLGIGLVFIPVLS